MNTTIQANPAFRPVAHLKAYQERYPMAWKMYDKVRSENGKELPAWPAWCFVPLTGMLESLTHRPLRDPQGALADCAILTAIAAWRPTQGVYKFDPEIFESLWTTPVTGNIPADVLLRLPEWGVWIDTSWDGDGVPAPFGPVAIHGFFAHLNIARVNVDNWRVPYSIADGGRPEIRFVMDVTNEHGNDVLEPVCVHLTGTMEEGIMSAVKEAHRLGAGFMSFIRDTPEVAAQVAKAIAPLVSLTMALCCPTIDRRGPLGQTVPADPPEPVKTKKGWRLFAPAKATIWEVGPSLGAAIRRARALPAGPSKGGTHSSPHGHIRNAHWHGYWTGPRKAEAGKRKFILKWLPPIPVNLGDDDDPEGTDNEFHS
jgi:hypothetical protein